MLRCAAMASEEQIDLLRGASAEETEAAGAHFDPREFAAREALEESHYWHLYRREVVLDLLRSAGAGPGARAIELGCGTGMVATYLNESGMRVDYADVHAEALAAARRRAERALGARAEGLRFVRLDVVRQFPNGVDYDAVLLLDVLEHLPDAHAALRSVRAHVRAGAALVVTVPAFPFLWSPWDDIERHERRYTRATLTELVQTSGFRVERMTHLFFPLFFAATGVKVLRVARDAVAPRRRTSGEFTELVEAKDQGTLGRALLRVLGVERRWLRRRDLPVGTSLACVARAA